jgi:hypothetical protein
MELASFFPLDSLGARGQEELGKYPVRGINVQFDYGVVKSECDISTETNGKMRARDTGPIGKFFEANSAAVGDFVSVSKVAERAFEVRLVKTDGPTV